MRVATKGSPSAGTIQTPRSARQTQSNSGRAQFRVLSKQADRPAPPFVVVPLAGLKFACRLGADRAGRARGLRTGVSVIPRWARQRQKVTLLLKTRRGSRPRPYERGTTGCCGTIVLYLGTRYILELPKSVKLGMCSTTLTTNRSGEPLTRETTAPSGCGCLFIRSSTDGGMWFAHGNAAPLTSLPAWLASLMGSVKYRSTM